MPAILTPSESYSITMRVEIENKPGMLIAGVFFTATQENRIGRIDPATGLLARRTKEPAAASTYSDSDRISRPRKITIRSAMASIRSAVSSSESSR